MNGLLLKHRYYTIYQVMSVNAVSIHALSSWAGAPRSEINALTITFVSRMIRTQASLGYAERAARSALSSRIA